MHFTGVHVLESEVLSRLPPEGESDINRTAYVRLIHEGAKVLGFLQNHYWGDLGAPRSLLRANLDVLVGRVPLDRFRPGADPFAGTGEIAPGVHVHPSASIDPSASLAAPALVHAGCVIGPKAQIGPEAVLGSGVRVDAGGSVVRAVCWEQTHVAPGERVQDCVAAPGVRLES
jgi:NDP-sugar pyrophosphorylase family protein